MTKLDWLMDVIESVQTIMLDDFIPKWLNTPIGDLNWATPLEAIEDGNGADVLEVADSYRIPVY